MRSVIDIDQDPSRVLLPRCEGQGSHALTTSKFLRPSVLDRSGRAWDPWMVLPSYASEGAVFFDVSLVRRPALLGYAQHKILFSRQVSRGELGKNWQKTYRESYIRRF